jgi:iron uptake system component EfeO
MRELPARARPDRHPLVLAAAVATAVATLTGCGGDSGGDSGGSGPNAAEVVRVRATDSACEVARTELTAGRQTFSATNAGAKAMELYVYAPGGRVVSELHNVDPGDTEDLTVELTAGRYEVACKPGKKGDGIRQKVTVTGSAAAADPRLTKAVEDYRAYVRQQVDGTLLQAQAFVAAAKAGDTARAKALYAPSRVGWESIEPVAESFGDLDPKVDAREADLEPGEQWTGWHRLEKALWTKGSAASEGKYADQLLVDLRTLRARVATAEITATSMANGAKELLDEVATGKITGEEEAFSHTDLVDFAANVDGAKKAFELLEPVVAEKDRALAETLRREFGDVQALLARYRQGAGYVSYDTVGAVQRKELSDAVNALGEPLSKLAAAVAS